MQDILEILKKPGMKFFFFVLSLGLLAVFIYMTRNILTALLIAFFIAYIFDPVVDAFERRRVPRSVAILLVVVALGVAGVFVLLILFPLVSLEIELLLKKIPRYLEVVKTHLLPIIDRVTNIDFNTLYAEYLSGVDLAGMLQEFSGKILSPVAWSIKSTFTGVVNVILYVLNLVIIPVIAFYLLKDIDRLKVRIVDLVPASYREAFVAAFLEIDEVLSSFLRGQLFVCFLLAAIYTVGLLIVDVPLAIVIGFVAGFANIVPYLGVAVGVTSALLLTLLEHPDLVHLLGVIGVFTVAQTMEGMVITPRIVGDRVGLHPVVVVVALMIWGQFFGFLGMLVAVPATAVLNVFLKRAVARYEASTFVRGDSYEKGVTG
ncbi:MAG: AI-2E family transporter [Deltaproteobacteria bacterium]|nr:MAG: AI-2E family transporter [Deltaproteobacteria bacterium]